MKGDPDRHIHEFTQISLTTGGDDSGKLYCRQPLLSYVYNSQQHLFIWQFALCSLFQQHVTRLEQPNVPPSKVAYITATV